MVFDYDLIVVGAGLSGLIVARNFAEAGARVLVLEAGHRVGGRIYDVYHTDYFRAARPKTSHEKSICNVIAAGADRFDANRHDYLIREIKRYGLTHSRHQPELNSCFFRSSKFDIKTMQQYFEEELLQKPPSNHTCKGSNAKDVKSEDIKNNSRLGIISSLNSDKRRSKTTLQQVIDKMNFDASVFDQSLGFDQIDMKEMDCSFSDYIKHHLNLNDDDDEDIIQFLKLQIFLLLGAEADDISTLMILQQVKQFNGDTKQMLLFPMQYDYLEEGFGMLLDCITKDILRYPGCEIRLNTSVIAISSIVSERDIPRVPKYDFPLPSSVLYTTKVKLSTGHELHSLGTIVTIPLNTVLSIQFNPSLPSHALRGSERCNGNRNYLKVFCYAEGVTVRISQLFSKWNYSHNCDCETIAHKLVDDENVLDPDIGATKRKIYTRRIMDAEYYDISKLIAEKAGRKKYSIVSMIARREDILQRRIGSIVQSYKQIHPDINLRLDSPYLTADDLDSNVLEPDVKSVVGDLSSIFYYDFARDKNIRSTWFNLRVGSSQLHSLMLRELSCPWGSENQSLYITGADMSSYWTGWLEGAAFSADQATKVMLPYLFPPRIERNFARKV